MPHDYLDPSDSANSFLISDAKDLARKYHHGQTRKSGDPYIQHLFNVLAILQKYNLPEELLIAGVLHDIIEDSEITQENIRKQFGTRVSFIISAVSKTQKPAQPEIYQDPLENTSVINTEFYEKLDRIESQNFRFLTYVNKFYYSVIADPWVAFVKIADQIDNLRDVEVFPIKKARRKLEEIHFYFWPIYERITEKQVMSHELVEPYEKIKAHLWKVLEQKKKELNIDLGPIPTKHKK